VEAPVAREVAATKRVWPSLANGFPPAPARLRAQIDAAAASAAALSVPAPFGEQQSRMLTGPATEIANKYRTYAVLDRRAWRLIAADAQAIEAGAPAASSFARANLALYIESVYDAHFALSQIGDKLSKAFHDLGGAKAFEGTLGTGLIEALANFYSQENNRLRPHAATTLGS
jgi:hypothetical protein